MSYKLFTAFMLPIFISCVSWYFTFIIVIIIGWFYWIIMSARQFHQIKFKQLLAFPDCFHSSVLFLLVLVPCVKRKNYCAFAFWSGIAGLLDPNLLDRRTAIVEQFTLDLGVYWMLVSTSFQPTKGWANSVILSSSFVSIFVGISRFVPHPHAIRSSWGRSGVLPAQPFILSLISTWEIFTTCFALSLKHADGIILTQKPRSLSHTLKSWTPAESRHPTRAIYWKEQRNCEKC